MDPDRMEPRDRAGSNDRRLKQDLSPRLDITDLGVLLLRQMILEVR